MTDNVILRVKDLKTYFKLDDGILKAVDGVSFDLHAGETLAIVGESGSGKSVTNLSIMNLVQSPPGWIAGGEVWFNGKDILKMPPEEIRTIRGNKISMIFQDPMTSLNPFLRISTQMIETIVLHQGLSKKDAKDKAIEMLKMAGIPAAEKRVDNYPHQFSGGMRQRVMIAMALSCNPEILIADEPTSALDVTIQAQILALLDQLKRELGTSLMLITHDLGVVARMAERVIVMYAGKVVEEAPAEVLFDTPRHPYTRGLLASLPRLGLDPATPLPMIPGQVPSLYDLPRGCRFQDRCTDARPICREEEPALLTPSPGATVRCWNYAR